MSTLAYSSKRWHIVLRCTICGPLGLLLVHLSRRLKCTIVITRCPSVYFHIFNSPLKLLNGIQQNLTGSKISTSSTKFGFFGPIGKKQDGRPGLWLTGIFSTSPLKPLNKIQRNLTGSKISTSSTKFGFFWPIRKKQDGRPSLRLTGIFSTSPLKQLNKIERKLDRKQDFNVLCQVCVFLADQKNKTVALASDLLRHFRLLLWNHLREFNETWQEARSQRPLPSLGVSGRSENKMAALASDWLRHFQLLLWNSWTEVNETWQEARS